jgi:hypothetical protein
MLELSPTFADTTLQKVAFYSPLEEFFWYGYKDSGHLLSIVGKISVTESADIAMLTMGKKPVDASLAAQSFLFRKSIRGVPVHVSYLKGRAQVP